jgi:hypothetical protein
MFMIDLGAPSYYSLLGVSPGADARAIRAAESQKGADVSRALAKTTDPDERQRLEAKLTEINGIGKTLANPQLREAYNVKNAHLTFFLVRPAAAPAFIERDVRLRWLHQVVRRFLIDRGQAVAPITDLERSDFSADFTANPILDRLQGTAPPAGGTT